MQGLESKSAHLEAQISLPSVPDEQAATQAVQRLISSTARAPQRRYTELRRIGAGGMGTVWKAWDARLERTVAIKRVSRHSAESVARFIREARTVAMLNHPNVVQIHDVEESGTDPMLVMEFVEGATLKEHLRTRPNLRWREVLALFRQAGAGLLAAHEKGIVHRDFKPANVMLPAYSSPARQATYKVSSELSVTP